MKKFLALVLLILMNVTSVIAKTDRTSAEYLRNKKHLAIMNPIAESTVQKIIKKVLKKEVGKGDYNVKFTGYTLSSMKKGIFKTIEIESENLTIEEIPIPYVKVKTVTDYNWIDITQKPPIVKTDMIFDYNIELTEKSINSALKQKNYEKKLENLNKKAYPLFEMHDVRVKIRHNKILIIMDYSLPLASNKQIKTFMVSTNFKVENGKIIASNIGLDNAYAKLPLEKVVNLINLINPLSFTLSQINDTHCKGQVESVNIENNIVRVDGKIFVLKHKGE